MAHLKESFVEDGKTFVFDGQWFEDRAAIRVLGTVRQGVQHSRIDVTVELGERNIESATEGELEDAAMTAVIEWVNANFL